MKRPCRAASLLALALAASAGPAFAGSQLFKCVDGGRTVYQQQACSVSTAVDPPASAVKADAASQAAPRRLKPASASASAAPATSR
jgi:hypothetical protein